MDDQKIVDLYWQRSEKAIEETDSKYGGYCFSIAYNVLANKEDAEESVSDTYMAAWNELPPHRPSILAAFLGKITRNISISRWRSRSAYKRGGGEIVLALEELDECVADSQNVEADYIRREAAAVSAAESGLPACWIRLHRLPVVVVLARHREQTCVLRYCISFMILQIVSQRMAVMGLPAMHRCVSDVVAAI